MADRAEHVTGRPNIKSIHVVWDETKLKQSAEQNQMDPDTIMGQYVSTQNSIYITPIKMGKTLTETPYSTKYFTP